MNYVSTSPTSTCGDFSYVMKEETRLGTKIYSDKEYNLGVVKFDIEKIAFFPWQSLIEYNWLNSAGQTNCNVSRRKMLFVYDKKGGNGKSTYVKDLCRVQRSWMYTFDANCPEPERDIRLRGSTMSLIFAQNHEIKKT